MLLLLGLAIFLYPRCFCLAFIYTYIAVLLTKEYINNWTFDVHSKVCGEVTHFLPFLYALQ